MHPLPDRCRFQSSECRTSARTFSVVLCAVAAAWQPTVVQTWSVPETMVQLRVRGDSVRTQASEPVLRMLTCSRGSTPAAYVVAAVDALTASWSRRQAEAVTGGPVLGVGGGGGGGAEGGRVGRVRGVGEGACAEAEGGPDPDPPLQATAIAMIKTAMIASSATRRVQ